MPERILIVWATRGIAFLAGWSLFGAVSFAVSQFVAAFIFALVVAGIVGYMLYVYLPSRGDTVRCTKCGQEWPDDLHDESIIDKIRRLK